MTTVSRCGLLLVGQLTLRTRSVASTCNAYETFDGTLRVLEIQNNSKDVTYFT